MKSRNTLAWLMALVLAGCAHQADPVVQSKAQELKGYQQLDKGTSQTFVGCSTCPQPSPKTIGTAPASPASVVATVKPVPDATANKFEIVESELTIHFPENESYLAETDRIKLTKVCESVEKYGRIKVSGRTDITGPIQKNRTLARERANVVVKELEACASRRGIKLDISIDARGACCYIASNQTEEGRRENRRAEVEVKSSETTRKSPKGKSH